MNVWVVADEASNDFGEFQIVDRVFASRKLAKAVAAADGGTVHKWRVVEALPSPRRWMSRCLTFRRDGTIEGRPSAGGGEWYYSPNGNSWRGVHVNGPHGDRLWVTVELMGPDTPENHVWFASQVAAVEADIEAVIAAGTLYESDIWPRDDT